MGLIATDTTQEPVMTSYSGKDKEALARRYTPEQIRVIEAGEEAISSEDLKTQARFRTDHWSLPYLDDMSVIKPVIDKKPKGPREAYNPDWRFMTQEERVNNMAKWLIENKDKHPEDRPEGAFPSRMDWWKWSDENRQQVGYDAKPVDSLAPEIPPYTDDKYYYRPKSTDGDDDGAMEHLRKQTGLKKSDMDLLEVKILVRHRVVNQTRLGKIQSQYVLAIAGDGNGRLGIGEGKATEPEEAAKQANMGAIRNMKPIPRYENRTIYGEVYGKVAASEVQLMSRPPGTFSLISY